jgi:hypothetical protein
MAGVPEPIVLFTAEDTDAERKAKKDRAKEAPKTLVIVAETLVGMVVDIELRNDTELHGKLESVDREMKCAHRSEPSHALHAHFCLNGNSRAAGCPD